MNKNSTVSWLFSAIILLTAMIIFFFGINEITLLKGLGFAVVVLLINTGFWLRQRIYQFFKVLNTISIKTMGRVTYMLYFLSIILVILIARSINSPIKFNEVKNERYLKVIDRLKDIRNAQIAFKSVNGIYSNDFEELIKFIDSAEFTITQTRDSSYMEYDRIYRIDMLREIVVTDTLGFVSVKDSLFSNNLDYKNMAYVPIEGIERLFSLKADVIDKNGYNVPVFEVRIPKDIILYDQNKDLLSQEKETVSVDGVNGPDLVLGSLTDVSTSGNWPTTFDFETK
tara:strand:+ start:2799 stop:3650 length:852 start_codon:yes stop_codon:yes gene_type:complete